ncbi:MAG: polysaccharide biosynthesis tyrosine autokinase [Armatimonadaceae bacterium]
MQEPLGPFQETSNTISLREAGDILRRRRAIILQTFVIVLVAGVLVTLFTAPTYQATSRMLLQPVGYFINQVNTNDPLSDLFAINQQYSVMTQVEMLQTAEIRKKVSEKLNTQNLPTMSVRPIEQTSIIEISAEGSVPELVASAPNTLMEIYKDQTRARRNAELIAALKFAKEKRDTLQTEVRDLERQIREFKAKYDILELAANKSQQMGEVYGLEKALKDNESQYAILQKRIAETNSELARLENVGQTTRVNIPTAQADQRVQQVDEQIYQIQTALRIQEGEFQNPYKLNPADVSKAVAVDTIDPEREPRKWAEAKQALARINKTIPDAGQMNFNDVVPEIARLLMDFKRQLNRKWQLVENYKQRTEQVNPVYRGFKDQLLQDEIDLKLLETNIANLRARLADSRGRLKGFPQWEQDWAQLQRRYNTASVSLDYYSDKISALELRNNSTREPVTIMQLATTPTEPIRPKKAQNIVFAGLLGLFFGLCLALLQELFDDRINSPEEAERVLRLPSLGHIPLIEEEGLRLIRDISTFSPLMEAYRSLRTNINFAAVGNQVKSIVITSSVPAEGKSTTVANLAMAMALDGKRVIIVDADLRRPSMHKLFKIDSSPGLTDVLVGTHSIDEVIQPVSGVQNVMVIPAGSPPPNPSELLGSAAMGQLLASLEARADVVLFDSPPALAVADSVVLASRANGVLLVVGHGETKKTSTKKALDSLARANANILGTVLNRMEGAPSGYYYGKYYIPATERPTGGSGRAASEPRALEQNSEALADASEDSKRENEDGEKKS